MPSGKWCFRPLPCSGCKIGQHYQKAAEALGQESLWVQVTVVWISLDQGWILAHAILVEGACERKIWMRLVA